MGILYFMIMTLYFVYEVEVMPDHWHTHRKGYVVADFSQI